jgi:hypothetical protein
VIHPRKQLYQLTKIEASSVPLFPGEDCAVRLEIDGVIAGVDVRAAESGLQGKTCERRLREDGGSTDLAATLFEEVKLLIDGSQPTYQWITCCPVPVSRLASISPTMVTDLSLCQHGRCWQPIHPLFTFISLFLAHAAPTVPTVRLRRMSDDEFAAHSNVPLSVGTETCRDEEAAGLCSASRDNGQRKVTLGHVNHCGTLSRHRASPRISSTYRKVNIHMAKVATRNVI